MRKLTSIILLISLLTLAGCQNPGAISRHGANQTTGIGDILASVSAESTSETTTAATAEITTETTPASEDINPYDIESILENGTEGVDIDLTVLSANMVYSEVFAMVYSPEDYIGKVIKMKGPFSYLCDEATGNVYYACIIRDATQCCAQGLEFIPADDYTYPDDFPEIGEDICVIGVFDTYMEGDAKYLTLRDAVLVGTDAE